MIVIPYKLFDDRWVSCVCGRESLPEIFTAGGVHPTFHVLQVIIRHCLTDVIVIIFQESFDNMIGIHRLIVFKAI